jgi:Mn-dependent DtxR family transcriptional regulator
VDTKSPPPLPAVLEAATPTTKIVYLYLEPYSEVQVTIVQLEKLLGISQQPAFKALRDLWRVGLVSLSPNVRGRPRAGLG